MGFAAVSAQLIAALAVAACSSAPATGPRAEESGERVGQPNGQRTLVLLGRGEPSTLAAKPFVAISLVFVAAQVRVFNATLDYSDYREVTQPYLAEALPQLNTSSWRVLPDGTMETTYRLRAGLTWHDGAPLPASDFVFAWRVFSTPELGVSASRPINLMTEVRAPDARTVVIAWRQLYPDAASLDLTFQALPQHILDDPLQRLDADAFVNMPFWTRDYVGLGPYRLTRWEPGAEISAVAFDGHALGRPKIGQIRILFTPDANAALAMILSGHAHVAADQALSYQEAATLERAWAARAEGTVNFAAVSLRFTTIQLRPEHANPRALLDVRVRRGLAHTLDRQTMMEVMTGGRGLVTYSLTSPRSPKYAAVEPTILRRPYDLRATQQSLEEAGLAKGPDGFYLVPGGEPFKLEVAVEAGFAERDNAIFVDSLRQAGVDAFTYVLPVALIRDNQARSLRPGLAMSGLGARPPRGFVSSEVPRPENRWGGNIRGGWSSPEYDRLWRLYDTTLDPAERNRYVADMERLIAEEVAGIPSFFTVIVNAHVTAVRGPIIRTTPDAGFGTQRIDTWEWTS